MLNIDEFEELVRTRRSIRHFRPDPVDEDLLHRLLDIAHWAPSGYNLQPTHMVLVTDTALKKRLHIACMKQAQILEAPAIVVFTGDKLVVENNLESAFQADRAIDAISAEYEKQLRGFIKLAFDQGPLGLGWFGKAFFVPLARLFTPIPSIPAVEKRYWLAKQVMLSSMIFMLAATAAGLSTVPMEGFDEDRVRKVLGIPSSHIVALVVPVGYAVDNSIRKSRLPVEKIIHKNGW
ncbi:MAG: nitroreductase family protein [Blastocatellia bacterium]|nr:nitroreductase family protein [Blastocatellia bacterium]